MAETLSALAAIAAAAGFVFGVYQYFMAQKWKKAEFAASILTRLHSDPDLDLCCKMLDWESRTVQVPSAYIAIAESKTFKHNWSDLLIAMSPDSEAKYTWQQMIYRDLFDKYFSFLEQANHFLNIGLVEQSQLASLRYWVKCIAQPRYAAKGVFRPYLRKYGYKGVLALIKKFELD